MVALMEIVVHTFHAWYLGIADEKIAATADH
jgi:hypothetical protein